MQLFVEQTGTLWKDVTQKLFKYMYTYMCTISTVTFSLLPGKGTRVCYNLRAFYDKWFHSCSGFPAPSSTIVYLSYFSL